MGSSPSKTSTAQHVTRLLHNHPSTPDQLLDQIRTKLFGDDITAVVHSNYMGAPNPTLDAPFTKTELAQALAKLIRNTAPGHDKITYGLLRNMNEEHQESLLECYNNHWAQGTVPAHWRHADITLLSKPNKPIAIDNLRPIALTSCVGKLFEHLVARRLTDYLEESDMLPHTMFGFRPHLSTQDVHLQLKELVINNLSKSQPSSILALDVQGAFDNVTHAAILNRLQTLNCGAAAYNYVRAFLTGRTATLHLGPHASEKFSTPAKGTPQGSVISPMLFNIALSGLPAQLNSIENVSHALYADDVTLWITKGSSGHQQDQLQEAIDTTLAYLQTCGLTCAPSKSALLVMRSRARGRPAPPTPDPTVTINGEVVPTTQTLRILGIHYHHDGSGAALLPRLQQTVTQLTHLIQRVCSRRHGLKEADTCKILQAMLISRITYGTPYVALKTSETNKIDIMIRKAYKTALGLPVFTSTDRLLQLGLHNTLPELTEAHTNSQHQRLRLTATGRYVLSTLGYSLPSTIAAHDRSPTSCYTGASSTKAHAPDLQCWLQTTPRTASHSEICHGPRSMLHRRRELPLPTSTRGCGGPGEWHHTGNSNFPHQFYNYS